MFTGITSGGGALLTAFVVLTGGTLLHDGAATADPDQDQKFLNLLNDKGIPAVDNDPGLIETANKACAKLDGGMSVGDLVELMRNNGFATNPLARLYPQARVTRTIDRFISAAVQAYCPYDEGKIASITGDSATGSSAPTHPAATYTHTVIWQGTHAVHSLVLASVIGPVPSGEIPPSNPLPAPAQPPPPPQQVQQVPEQPPPSRHYTPPPPQRPQPPPQQVEPPPQQVEPPPQEAEPPPPEAGPSPQQATPAPPPAEPPPPAPRHAPGFVQLAP